MSNSLVCNCIGFSFGNISFFKNYLNVYIILEGATYELFEVTEETVIHRVETAFQLYLSVMPKAGAVSQIEQGLSELWATELSGGCYLLSYMK